ncbi:MAG: hypothetical protein IPP08_04065 [Chlorobiota bacterium]|jgi:hypothetical protein|nr:hypothetical protein [Chlorobiota bacterium]QQS67350.1 MAG: hypothetical protein IPP08_04065 [Chlorobiota bacterium]
MKLLVLLSILFIGFSNLTFNKVIAQTDDMNIDVVCDTMNSAPLVFEFTKDYDQTFKAVKSALEGLGYIVNYSSKTRNLIETDYKVFANRDNFHEEMNKYGQTPYIRSPGWKFGRGKIVVAFKVVGNKMITRVLSILSGYEDRITNIWHYWRSNGLLDDEASSAIVESVEAIKEP